ncbi:hypothetical protein [Nocardioides sp.]|uniref:hypothetical protein n=1 Tax=Nocardioides sp. TaxID=35761 RepID=UPI002728D109|nr:hypothetical protein [Nocardioides sp.]MDO9455322.1 hypothetical protein [Nocardioides sp.]
MGRHRTAHLLAALVAVTALAGCSGDEPGARPTPSASPSAAPFEAKWEAVDLPAPPGPSGRIALRDATRCGDTWYVVGGVFTSATQSQPAWWSSPDGRTWTSRDLAPRDFFARGSVLSSVACHGADVVALGGRPGGAHGNLRTSSWYLRPDGVLADVPALFTQYGGVEAVNVAHVAGGPAGWTISGNRVSGAAVWSSPDARDFVRNDTDPALRHDPDHRFLATDQVADGRGWVLVGSAGLAGRGGALAPWAWSSADGRSWTREEVPTTDEFSDLERVAADGGGDGLLALGLRGQRFGAWHRDAAGTWRAGVTFGGLDPGRTSAPAVAGLATADGLVVTTVSDGTDYQLWTSTDGAGWHQVATPTTPPAGSGRVMTAATDGRSVLLVADDERAGRLWLSPDAGRPARPR